MDKFELYKIGEDIVKELNESPSGEKLRELFNVRTAHWKYPMQHTDACATIGTFSDLEIKGSDAFELISSAVDLCLAQTDEDLIITSAFLLMDLVTASDTTECPNYLDEKWDELMSHITIENNDESDILVNSICEWYRR